MTVVFPVFVLTKDSREILCFKSLAEMQNCLERIDIENAEFEAWSDLRHFAKLAGVKLDEDQVAPDALYERIMANKLR